MSVFLIGIAEIVPLALTSTSAQQEYMYLGMIDQYTAVLIAIITAV
jgi:hypothetical protein